MYGFASTSRYNRRAASANSGRRTVFPSREVYHLWANEAQAAARNGTSSVSFNGADAFSYAAVIGRIVRNDAGRKAYLVSNRSWSVTTSGHQSALRSSIPRGETVFHLSDLDGTVDHADVLSDYRIRMDAAVGRFNRARRRKDMFLSDLAELKREADAYCEFYSLPQMDTRSVEQFIADRGPELEQAAKERAAKERELQKQKKIELAGEAAEWQAGRRDSTRYPDTLLRVVGDTVQTSRGATVPLEAAKQAYKALVAGVSLLGQRIGHFTVSKVTATQLEIGCHVIPRKEIDRLATLEKWA